jgi:hypothetical protein
MPPDENELSARVGIDSPGDDRQGGRSLGVAIELRDGVAFRAEAYQSVVVLNCEPVVVWKPRER